MKVLIACEFSGIVRDAFLARGHHAISCDLLPTERPGNHIVGDVLTVLNADWDLVIAFPPCTYLANSGVRWLYKADGSRNGERWARLITACQFFNELLGEDMFSRGYQVPRIAIENPVQHKHARERIRKPNQIIQPWQFGHGEVKATCLWLKGLPLLTPTDIVDGRTPRVHHEPPSPERWKNRSRTLPGIAKAMAAQWGALPVI